MKIVSIKRLVLSLVIALGSVMTLPAYAWPDTDEMNMCGAAIKKVRAYGGDHRGWSAHDNYINHLGAQYYYLANCPQSKATKNYKGKNWTPNAKMRTKVKSHKKHAHKHKKHHGHNSNHKNHADCIRVDKMNNSARFLKKANRSYHKQNHKQHVDMAFYRQAQAVLNMGKAKRVHKKKAHNPNHKNHADCIRTDGLNSGGAIVRVTRKR